jgi:TatD DNase family protein
MLRKAPMLVDSHCHIDFAEPDDRPALVERAHAAGVTTMLTIGTKAEELPEVIEIASSYPDVWCTVGVHPHEAQATPDTIMDRLVEMVGHPKVVGIGETGLDYHYDHSPRDRQAQLFRAQCRLARAAGLPLIVHSRESDSDTAAILAEEGMSRGIIHCFSSGRALSEPALKLGFHISISGIVTFKNADELREIVTEIPLDRLLIETDSPYLAPIPMRGKTNEPAFLVHTAAKVAELKRISVEELGRVTTDNFFRLFGNAKRPAMVE